MSGAITAFAIIIVAIITIVSLFGGIVSATFYKKKGKAILKVFL